MAIIGRPGKFSAGFDLSVMTAGPDQARDLLRAGADLALRIYTFPIPVVLGATGHALAMGAILLMAADVRIGADGPFKVGLPEVEIGMPLPRVRGRAGPRPPVQAPLRRRRAARGGHRSGRRRGRRLPRPGGGPRRGRGGHAGRGPRPGRPPQVPAVPS